MTIDEFNVTGFGGWMGRANLGTLRERRDCAYR